jgi:hypothetical protein
MTANVNRIGCQAMKAITLSLMLPSKRFGVLLVAHTGFEMNCLWTFANILLGLNFLWMCAPYVFIVAPGRCRCYIVAAPVATCFCCASRQCFNASRSHLEVSISYLREESSESVLLSHVFVAARSSQQKSAHFQKTAQM